MSRQTKSDSANQLKRQKYRTHLLEQLLKEILDAASDPGMMKYVTTEVVIQRILKKRKKRGL